MKQHISDLKGKNIFFAFNLKNAPTTPTAQKFLVYSLPYFALIEVN